jgi:hypothetical protein
MLNITVILLYFPFGILLGLIIKFFVINEIKLQIYNLLNKINIKKLFSFGVYIFIFKFIFYTISLDISDLTLNMEEDSNQSSNDKIKTPEIKNETEIKDNTININSPVGSLHISDILINRAINAMSTIGGMKLGIEAAKNVQGVGGKLVAGVGGAILAHSIKKTINTIDEANKGNNSNNNFMFSLINSENITNNSNLDLTQYPMSLLSDLNLYQNLALFFLFLILNSYLSIILKNINIEQYMPSNPNSRIAKTIKFLYERYLNIWYKSSLFVFIFSWICLFICISMSKLCLSIILS